jgi:hypothetical protein
MSDPKTDDQSPAMSKEDIAYFIRTMWESLLKPNWPRADLIDLGMAIFTKTPLSKMDQEKLGKLLPNLAIVAEHFGKQVAAKFSTEFDAFLQVQAEAHKAEALKAEKHRAEALKVASIAPPLHVVPEATTISAAEEPAEQTVEQPAEPPAEQPAEQPLAETPGEPNG